MGKQSHLTFALEGQAALSHACQSYSHSCPAEFSKCVKHDAGVACVAQMSWSLNREWSTETDLHLQ